MLCSGLARPRLRAVCPCRRVNPTAPEERAKPAKNRAETRWRAGGPWKPAAGGQGRGISPSPVVEPSMRRGGPNEKGALPPGTLPEFSEAARQFAERVGKTCRKPPRNVRYGSPPGD